MKQILAIILLLLSVVVTPAAAVKLTEGAMNATDEAFTKVDVKQILESSQDFDKDLF